MSTARKLGNTKPSICFVALNAYGVLSRRVDVEHIGGAEVQQSLIARELVRRGYRVSFVVLDHGQPDGQQIDGIQVYKAYRRDAGVPIARFLHPRITSLWSAMRRAGASVYYQRGAATETGLVVRWCRWNGRRVVFALAHDSNCDPKFPLLPGFAERNLYEYGLRRANAVVAQTNQQKRLLFEGFGLSSVLVPSCCEAELFAEHPSERPAGPAFFVLWVGRLSPEKRPEWVPELAGAVPNCRFDIVGRCNVRSTYGRELMRQLESLPNVTYHGYVAHADMVALYRRANLLLCTSEAEGFPNVFLEAWACGTPVLSSVDPDALIEKHGLGEVPSDFEAMKRCLLDARAGLDLWRRYGRAAREYVSAHHSIATTVDALECAIHVALKPRGLHRPTLPLAEKAQRSVMPHTAEEFSFGKNWANFLRHSLQADQIEIAKAQTARFLGLTDLEGSTFIDIGCGSGIFSHAAHALGAAEVISFDVDPLSVRCCEQMREHAGSPENWKVFHGSVLDRDLISRLPPADIVYSWGVLHHTGDMWTAIRIAAGLVKPGGRFFISIYNRLEFQTLRSYRGSHGWQRLKRIYNNSPAIVKRSMECWFAAKDVAAFIVTLRNPLREIRRYREKRGMSWWYDIVDWVGGYPYEFASTGEVFDFCHGELGLQLERLNSTSSLGCNEFLFIRPSVVGPATSSQRAVLEHPVADGAAS